MLPGWNWQQLRCWPALRRDAMSRSRPRDNRRHGSRQAPEEVNGGWGLDAVVAMLGWPSCVGIWMAF